MKTYRKKPVVIEAVQFTDNSAQVLAWIVQGGGRAKSNHYHQLEIGTLEGTMTAFPGDWIIKGVQGEFYPTGWNIFEATYEEVK